MRMPEQHGCFNKSSSQCLPPAARTHFTTWTMADFCFFRIFFTFWVASAKKDSCLASISPWIKRKPAKLNPMVSRSSWTRDLACFRRESMTGTRTRLETIWPWCILNRNERHLQESSTSQPHWSHWLSNVNISMTTLNGRTIRASSNSLKRKVQSEFMIKLNYPGDLVT